MKRKLKLLSPEAYRQRIEAIKNKWRPQIDAARESLHKLHTKQERELDAVLERCDHSVLKPSGYVTFVRGKLLNVFRCDTCGKQINIRKQQRGMTMYTKHSIK